MRHTDLDRVIFLLGSGVSFPAKVSSIDTLTDRVLSGERFQRHSNKVWWIKEADGVAVGDDAKRITTFLKRLKTEVDLHYALYKDHKTNYEDLYHVAAQLYDAVMGSYQNPALKPFLDKIVPDSRELFIEDQEENRPQIVRDYQGLAYLSSETTNYIADVVWRVIQKEQLAVAQVTHLDCIKCACQEVNTLDLFTVNHDMLLEKALGANSIPIADGFGARDEFGVRHWNPQTFEAPSVRIRLVKLHGSMDWFYFCGTDEGRADQFLGLHPQPGLEFLGGDGRLLTLLEGRPVLLMGTVNKMLEYLRGIFLQLHFQFYHRLAQTDQMVVSGYGFGDDGINMRIREWMGSSDDRRLVIIDPSPLAAQERFGGWHDTWDNWKGQGKLVVMERGIDRITWTEIKEALAR